MMRGSNATSTRTTREDKPASAESFPVFAQAHANNGEEGCGGRIGSSAAARVPPELPGEQAAAGAIMLVHSRHFLFSYYMHLAFWMLIFFIYFWSNFIKFDFD
jgi:hypothetical protein